MTKRFIHLLYQPRLPLAAGALLAWIALLTLHSCTRTVAVKGQDSTYFGRLSFVIENNATFSQYYSALQQTGYLDTLSTPGPYTVMLPNDDAYKAGYLAFTPQSGNLSTFEWSTGKPLSPYVAYDIVRGKISLRQLPLGDNQPLVSIMGGTLYVSRYLSGMDTVTTVNGLQVISPDNPGSNGWLNVISGCVPNPQIYPTVLQVLQSDTNFAAFVTALQRTHLDTLLNGNGPFTVLAPQNSALPPVDSILVADPVKLSQLVKYHILPGRYFKNDIQRRQATDTLELATLNGETLGYFATGNGSAFPSGQPAPAFYANGNVRSGIPYAVGMEAILFCGPIGQCYNANTSDLPAANGVVHMINGTLNP